MRQILRLVVLLALVAWLPASAGATPATFTGTLRLVLGNEADPTAVFDVTVSGSGAADITFSGGVIDSATVGAGAFVFATGALPVTDPDAVPVTSVDIEATSGAGSFTGLASGGGGTLLVDGSFQIGTFGNPPSDTFLLSQVGQGVGVGGSINPAGPLGAILYGAPWSVGSVTSGPSTLSGSTSANELVLVTPFTYASWNFSTAYGYAVLDLHLTQVPEPGTGLLVAVGLAVVGLRGRRVRG